MGAGRNRPGERRGESGTFGSMAIQPDTKDWTWVLDKQCPECGFDASAVSFTEIPALTRANASQWVEVLQRPNAATRPYPEVWSPLEYACHVRDVFRLFNTRLGLMLDEDGPRFANWDQDETAITDRYGEQDPVTVSTELVEAGDVISAAFEAVTLEQLDRTGTRSDGATFTVDSFARYFAHDPIHHIWDVSA